MLVRSPQTYPSPSFSASKMKDIGIASDEGRPYLSAIFICILALAAAFSIPYLSAFK